MSSKSSQASRLSGGHSTNGGDINSWGRIQIKVLEQEVSYIIKWATHSCIECNCYCMNVATMDIAMVNVLWFCSHKMPSTKSKVFKYGWCLWDYPCGSKHVKIDTYFHMFHVLRWNSFQFPTHWHRPSQKKNVPLTCWLHFWAEKLQNGPFTTSPICCAGVEHHSHA